MSRLRRQPAYILGGSISRAPNGYRAIIQTTQAWFPVQTEVQQLWSNAIQRRYTPRWDGIEPEGAMVLYFSPARVKIRCGVCNGALGAYVAYGVKGEYGLVEDRAYHVHPRESFPADHFRSSPSDRFAPTNPRFRIIGHETPATTRLGMGAADREAIFTCPRCRHVFRRNLMRLGKTLFEERATVHTLAP